jgi:hypothetical protein
MYMYLHNYNVNTGSSHIILKYLKQFYSIFDLRMPPVYIVHVHMHVNVHVHVYALYHHIIPPPLSLVS